MNPKRRHTLLTLAAALAGARFQAQAQAQAQAPSGTYPNRPITLIVPYTTGTTADTLARMLGA